MALKKFLTLHGAVKIDTGNGLYFTGEFKNIEQDGYYKVVSTSGGKDRVTANVSIFNGEGGVLLGEETYSFIPDMEGENFIRQAYLHLKTLPEFAEAEDC